MIFPFLDNRENEIDLLILILLTVLVTIPYFLHGKYIDGIDTKFHLNRIQGVAANLKAGIFPPRVELNWLDNAGYGVGLFYSETFLIIPGLLISLGYPLLKVYKILEVLLVFCTLFTHYYAAKTISHGSHSAGISSAIFISLATYRLQTQYIRDGLGESLATIFLPLIVVGLYQILSKKPNGWITVRVR